MVKGKLSAPKIKSTQSRGASLCQSKVAGKEFTFKETIIETHHKVLKIDKNIYISSECHENAKIGD